MAQKALITVDDSYYNVKKALITVDGVHHRIKKAFVTIGGVHRPCWNADSGSSGTLTYYGTAEALTSKTKNVDATTLGDKAVFRVDTKVSYYDKNLVRHSLGVSVQNSSKVVATEDYLIFGGGSSAKVSAFDYNFTEYPADQFYKAKQNIAATATDGYVLFSYGEDSNYIDAYDSRDLTHRYFIPVSPTRSRLAATFVGDYALFGGGVNISSQKGVNTETFNTVEAYHKDDLSEVTSIGGLTYLTNSGVEASLPVSELAATSVGNYALFGGGTYYRSSHYTSYNVYNSYKNVCAYEADTFTRKRITSLPNPASQLASAAFGSYALFGGGVGKAEHISGYEGYGDRNEVVAYLKDTLTQETLEPLSKARRDLAATSVGNYCLFGGGEYTEYISVSPYEMNVPLNIVDVYTIV